ncbi:hypothetical protein [Kribbella deserti]|uniref:Uncharacterized protein n=1 Tax=Kribbella deserti TaxID=1926257 RepID=A0ABV6QCV8_9ACTN
MTGAKNVNVHGCPATLDSQLSKGGVPNRQDNLFVLVVSNVSLRVEFGFKVGRGGTDRTALDTERAALLEPLTIDILGKHFS